MFAKDRTKNSAWDVDNPDYSTIVDLIYEASLQPGLWQEVLRLITRIVPAASAILYASERVPDAPPFYHSYGDDPHFTAQYIMRWAHSNPIIEAVAGLAPGDVAGLASVLDYDALKLTQFFQEWARPQGFRDVINVILERTPSRVASLSLIRADRHGMADLAAIRCLRRLTPHLTRAVRIGRVFGHATVERQRLSQALDALAEAVLVMDSVGAVVHANKAAEAILHRGLSLASIVQSGGNERDGLPLNGDATQSSLNDGMLVETHDGVMHVGYIVPLSPCTGLRLLVIRARPATAAAVAKIETLFALTSRERDLLCGLVEGGGLPATASALGMPMPAARGHLESLYSKTGSHRQADLVALVSNMASLN